MPPEIKALVLAEGASLDAFTGRLTAFNILEEILAPKFPAYLPRLAVVVIYERSSQDAPLELYERVTVHGPDDREIARTSTSLAFALRFHRSVHVLSLPLAIPGEYSVRVENFANPTHSKKAPGLDARRAFMVTLRPSASELTAAEPERPALKIEKTKRNRRPRTRAAR